MSGRQTPLLERHRQLNAKMTQFAGFEMPVRYHGIRKEHQAVRSAAGLFDVSHMGEFWLTGSGALDQLQNLTVNDVSSLEPGKAQYTLLCNSDGGIVDDLLIYQVSRESYMLVVNAANIEKDRDWILESIDKGTATFEDRSDQFALLALQGPASADILSPLTDLSPESIRSFCFEAGSVSGEPGVMVSATGYTGERGFELYITRSISDPGVIWDALLEQGQEQGLMPVGLGARDTLRLEMGLPLYGQDLTDRTTPLEAGLGWVVKLEKGTFIGSEALVKQKERGVERRLIGLTTGDHRKIPRNGYEVLDKNGETIGTITSGGQSITLNSGIGLAYLPAEKAVEGDSVQIRIRRSEVPATLKKPPFITINH